MTAKTATESTPAVVVEQNEIPGMGDYLKENAKPIRKLEKLADELVESMKQSLVCFFALCEAARDLDKKAVRLVLREKKFEESRISEILRVAHSAPEIWDQYKTKAIGFKLALKKAREVVLDDSGEKSERKKVSQRTKFMQELARLMAEYTADGEDIPKFFNPRRVVEDYKIKDLVYSDESRHIDLPDVKLGKFKVSLSGMIFSFKGRE